MAAGIVRDPLFVSAAAQHDDLMITPRTKKRYLEYRVERPSGGVLASLVLGRLLDIGL
jgi:hypothetical protein